MATVLRFSCSTITGTVSYRFWDSGINLRWKFFHLIPVLHDNIRFSCSIITGIVSYRFCEPGINLRRKCFCLILVLHGNITSFFMLHYSNHGFISMLEPRNKSEMNVFLLVSSFARHHYFVFHASLQQARFDIDFLILE